VANNYRGEARLLRALCYYSLLTLYSRPSWDVNGDSTGVPLRLNAELELNPAANSLARSKVSEVYAQIITDLNFAETNLPATATPTRVHRNTAIALKTRVYLSMGQYANVITEANKIVPNSPPFIAPSGVANRLEANIATVFPPLNNPPVQGTYVGPEVLLTMPFTALDLPGTQNGLGSYFKIQAPMV